MELDSKLRKAIAAIFLCTLAGCITPEPAFCRKLTTYEQALGDIDNKRFESAQLKLLNILAKNPSDADAHAELSRTYMDTNQIDKAFIEANKAIQYDPRMFRAYATKAYCEFRQNHMKEGFSDSATVLKLYTVNPLDWTAWYTHKNLSHAYQMMHRAKEFAEVQTNVYICDLLTAADEARNAGQLNESLQKIDSALKVDSRIPDLWFFRGVIYQNQGQNAQALADFSKAIALTPTAVPMLYYFRGDTYQQLGKHQQAIADFTKIIQAKPKLVAYRFVCETGRFRSEGMREDLAPVSLGDIYVLRAQSYAILKDKVRARKDLETASQLDPTDDKAIAKKAELHLEAGMPEQAIKDYSKSVAANPNDWTRYKERADAYMQLGKNKEALDDYTQVIKLTPNEPGAYMLRAVALKSMKKYDQAIADFSKVLQLRNDDDDAYMERAECYRLMHRYNDALADLDKATNLAHASKTFINEERSKIRAEMKESNYSDGSQTISASGSQTSLADISQTSSTDSSQTVSTDISQPKKNKTEQSGKEQNWLTLALSAAVGVMVIGLLAAHLMRSKSKR